MKRQLIITADDYGLCEEVNRAIEECLSSGAVGATCVMVNMPLFTAAASLREEFPHRSIGIHWTLTQGAPVLAPSRVTSLLSATGDFCSIHEFRRRWLRRQIDASEVRNELRAQCERFCEIAGRPDFWNTHENAHVLPGIFQLCVLVGQELGIPAMRSHRRLTVPRNTSAGRHSLTHPLYWLKGRIIAHWADKAAARGVLMPEGRLYMPGYDGNAIASLDQILKRVPWGEVTTAIELVVHPATRINDGLFGSMTQSRIVEYSLLRDPAFPARLRQNGIELVGFEVLAPRPGVKLAASISPGDPADRQSAFP